MIVEECWEGWLLSRPSESRRTLPSWRLDQFQVALQFKWRWTRKWQLALSALRSHCLWGWQDIRPRKSSQKPNSNDLFFSSRPWPWKPINEPEDFQAVSQLHSFLFLSFFFYLQLLFHSKLSVLWLVRWFHKTITANPVDGQRPHQWLQIRSLR